MFFLFTTTNTIYMENNGKQTLVIGTSFLPGSVYYIH